MVATKLDKLRRKLPLVRKCYPLLKQIGRPTVEEADHLLGRLGCATNKVRHNGSWECIYLVLAMLKPHRSASLVPLVFNGGPPWEHGQILRAGVFQGSLYTFLLDRILFNVAIIGLEATAKKLGIPVEQSATL